MKVIEPFGPQKRKAPRPVTSPKYVYVWDPENSSTEEVVLSIINGMTAKQVDPGFYPYIYPRLQRKRSELIAEGNLSAAKAARNGLDFIDRYNEKKEEKKLRMLRREELEELERQKREERMRNALTPERMDRFVRLAVEERFNEIDRTAFKRLGKELRKRQKAAIKSGHYKDAGEYDRAARRVSVLESDIRYEEITAARAEETETKVTNARRGLADTRAQWNERVAQAKEIRDSELQDMRVQLRDAMREFDEQFEMEVPLSYRKYSSKYLEMRQKEQRMVKSKHFMEAKELHEEADELQKQEEAEFRRKYEADLMAKRAEFERRVREKMDVIESRADQQLFLIERQANLEIGQRQTALKRRQKQSEEAEMLITYGPHTAPPSVRESRSARSARTERSTRRTGNKSARSCRITRPERTAEETFRQRRAINNVLYSKLALR